MSTYNQISGELEAYRKSQKLAYEIVLKVKAKIVPGMTEKEAAQLLEETMLAENIKDWLHRPLAWFGERTCFDGMRNFKDFLPSERVLLESDTVILDIAPIVEGHLADIGYSFSMRPSQDFEKALQCLRELREKIPIWILEVEKLGDLWKRVDSFILQKGYRNCYELYPFSVLGHRVGELAENKGFAKDRLSIPVGYFSWFGLSAYRFFAKNRITAALLRKTSDQPITGLWAIEPHLGAGNFGVKFEEILVVQNNEAYWLSNEVPHVA